ncbi:MAG: PBSX family phage terminase large subunit, partial [Staphylococcus equorum]|nr:PBSX family phage terminase large subunit [Staphylococcus equorum]
VWYEEAAEFKDAEEFDQTNVTFMRQKHRLADKVYFFWSYNPPRNPYNWINEWSESLKDVKGYLVHESSYKDDQLGFVTPQMLDDINRIKENDYDYYRYIYLGEPVGLGTNVYNMSLFQPITELFDDDYVQNIYFSIDSGHQVSATTCSCYALTARKRVILLDTYYYSPAGKVNKKAPTELSKDIHEFIERLEGDYEKYAYKYTIDSAEGALRNQYYLDYNGTLHGVNKQKKVDMIDHVQNLLAQGRFYYLDIPNNQIFIDEHKNYQWDEDTLNSDDPKVIKEDDHAVDNFQYFCLDSLQDLGLKW